MKTSSWPMVDHFGRFKFFFGKFIIEISSWPMVDHSGGLKIFLKNL